MNYPLQIRLLKLELIFSSSTETLKFDDVSYYYGQMGAGKSSIARLIDYCFGGNLDFSTALQNEFVSAILSLVVNGNELVLERPRSSDQVHGSWSNAAGERFDRVLPARKAAGIVIPGTEVEVLSDLLFYLADIRPPRVRRSKLRETSELGRLSFRDLLWYCYLDQDSFDNSFFNLETGGDTFKRLKSLDVMRFVLGFHQEQVAELESDLQELNLKRLQLQGAAKSLSEGLIESGVATEEEILARTVALEQEILAIAQQLLVLREQQGRAPHGTDKLKEQGQILFAELVSIDEALPFVERTIDQDQRHINDIEMLGLKVLRAAGARAVLGGVDFIACPRCAQTLPHRDPPACQVCGQPEPEIGTANVSSDLLENDAKARIAELQESIERHQTQQARMRRRRQELSEAKQRIDEALSQAMREYDSAYLSSALVLERRRAEAGQQIIDLRRLVQLPRKVQALYGEADELLVQQAEVKRELAAARQGAETDMGNLRRLETIFLDCLVRAHMPGISYENVVKISHLNFLPVVLGQDAEDVAVTSFSNLSSGGKKTLYKACFALAIHRLAAEVGALLPSFLVIDSPMKNISERENKEQFEGYHQLVYELLANEMEGTQVILIDKEYLLPAKELGLSVSIRHMMPDSEENPPLIPYYRGL